MSIGGNKNKTIIQLIVSSIEMYIENALSGIKLCIKCETQMSTKQTVIMKIQNELS